MRLDRVKVVAEMARVDVTTAALSEKSGVSRATISAVRGGKRCTEETALKIARALGVDVTKIMED